MKTIQYKKGGISILNALQQDETIKIVAGSNKRIFTRSTIEKDYMIELDKLDDLVFTMGGATPYADTILIKDKADVTDTV